MSKSKSPTAQDSIRGVVGAIRPALKVQILSPEEPSGQEKDSDSLKQTALEHHRTQLEQEDKQKGLRSKLIVAFAVVLTLFIAIVVIVLSPDILGKKLSSIRDFDVTSNKDKTFLAEPVIQIRKEVNINSLEPGCIAKVQIDENVLEFRSVLAFWNADSHRLKLAYFIENLTEDQSKTLLKNRNTESLPASKLLLSLRLSGNARELSSETLRGYTITLRHSEREIRFHLPHSARLDGFGAVNRLSGKLESGSRIKGAIRNSRSKDDGTLRTAYSWNLTFDTPLGL